LPTWSFTNDTSSGLYRIGASDIGFAIAGVKVMEWTASLTTISQGLTANGTISLLTTTADTALIIAGNRLAANASTDVAIRATANRTAGSLCQFQNNNGLSTVLNIEWTGQIIWPSGPASTATSPSPSAVTAITPNTNIAAANGLGFWKDAMNVVHIKGSMQNNTGAGATNLATTNPLPAGFRPSSAQGRLYTCSSTDGTTNYQIQVLNTGAITANGTGIVNGGIVYLDGVSFLAEQ
jgi:hypothetical protein